MKSEFPEGQWKEGRDQLKADCMFSQDQFPSFSLIICPSYLKLLHICKYFDVS